jgi:hypothetical protein
VLAPGLYSNGQISQLFSGLAARTPEVVNAARQRYVDEYLSGPQLLTYYLLFNSGHLAVNRGLFVLIGR